MRWLLLLACVLAVPQAQAAVDSRILVDPATNFLVDSFGRVRFFHGINMVEKGEPWYPPDLLNATWVRYLQQWGFNALRLGTMWTGTEPVQGQFNETYLGVLDKITNNLAAHGIYSLLDMHQDVWSSKFDLYDGAPRWLVDLSKPKHEYPWPLPRNLSDWWMHYFAEATGVAFQDLYSNTHGETDYWTRFWVKIAQRFRNRPEILGYELINEPWCGDHINHPEVLLPGVAGSKNLMPAYDKLNKAIREVDPVTLVFYEPVTWGGYVEGAVIGSGFDRVPGGPLYNNRSVLSWHHYCWFKFGDGSKPYEDWAYTLCDKIIGPNVFKVMSADVKRYGGAAFLTEFGLCDPDGSGSADTVECEFIMNKADEHLQSWTFWDRKFFDERGNPRLKAAKQFARGYARAVAGIPLAMSFNFTTARFQLSWSLNPAITQPTEVFLPAINYPRGFNVDCSRNVNWTAVAPDTIHIRPFGSPAKGELATVTVLPKA